MGKRGGKSAREASVRGDLANVMQREYNVQPELASRYAGQIVRAVDGDVNKCKATCMWVSDVASVPQQHVQPVARALDDYLRARRCEESVGGKPVQPGESVVPAMGLRLPSGVIVMPAVLAMNATQRGTSLTSAGGNTTLVAGLVTAHFIQLLRNRDVRLNQSLVLGYELQWEQSVATALSDIECEFSLRDLTETFSQMDEMCRVLFLREVKAKIRNFFKNGVNFTPFFG